MNCNTKILLFHPILNSQIWYSLKVLNVTCYKDEIFLLKELGDITKFLPP